MKFHSPARDVVVPPLVRHVACIVNPPLIARANATFENSVCRFGFITFDDVSLAKKALDLDGTDVDGFNIGLRFAEDKPRDSGGRGFDGGRGRGRGGRGGSGGRGGKTFL